MKKLISLVLSLVLVISLIPATAFAASSTLAREEELASDLKKLGVFKGVSDTDFALGRAPTRTEALVMLIRVLGKENDALKKGGRHPFLDVPSWADAYVGYAYENKLTNGVSATKFGGNTAATASQYLTFVLRALGYSDASGDFTWDNPFALARETGIMRGNPDILNFLRGDVVLISYAALEAKIKGTNQTLAQKLIAAGSFSAEAYSTYYNVSEFEHEDDAVKTYSAQEIYQLCSPAVFYIENYDKNGTHISHGSGFFIDSEGTAVTNYHVLEGAASAQIYTTRKNWYDIVGVYDYSVEEDWAVIKVDIKESPYLEISKETVTGGDQVFAIGSPRGFDNTISEGLVSNANRILGGQKFIQTSAPISPGSSGGALINKNGKVIGITSAEIIDSQNLNLAIPISAIEGSSRKKAVPLTNIGEFENELILGDINVAGLKKDIAADMLLRTFVYNYSNETISGNPAYIESAEEDGIGIVYALCVDEDEDKLYAMCYYSGTGGELAYAMIELTPTVHDAYTFYSYRESDKANAYTASGYADVSKDLVCQDMYYYFEETSGMQYGEEFAHRDFALDLICASLGFADYVLQSYLYPYGVSGIADLGFTDFQ